MSLKSDVPCGTSVRTWYVRGLIVSAIPDRAVTY